MADPFMSAFGGSGTMFGGRPPVFRPDIDIAGVLGMSGPQGMMLNMAAQPLISQAIGPGYVPGQFNPSVNFYDQYRARSMIMAQQQAMRAGSQIDKATYYDMMRGMAAVSGTPFGVREARAASAMADDIAAVAPYVAPLMPDLFDKLHGTRGSAMLMSQMVSSGARYGIDPVTGMRGMSPTSVNALTQGMFDSLYGPGADVGAMRGITAGRAGQLYDEMQRRGLMGGGSRDELTRAVAQEAGVAVDQVTRLPDFDAKLRTADMDRSKEKLKAMAGAVSAMQDLFGEMGQPDAPLPQLLNAIEALTQGGLSNMRPERVEQMVRQASNVTRAAGASLESLFQMAGTMTGRTDALGLDRSFATKSAVGGMAFADAFGRQMGGLKAFGLMNKDQMAMLGAQLEANAAASPAANRLAAVMRLGEEFGAFDTKGDSDAARMFQALKNGQDTFTDSTGKVRNVSMTAPQLQQLMTKSGVDAKTFERVLAQTNMNQATIAQNDQITRITRRSQAQLDIAPRLAQQFDIAFANIGGDEKTRKALSTAAAEAGNFLLDMDRDQMQKFADRDYTAVVDKAAESLRRQGVNVDPAMRKKLEQEVKMAVGAADEAVKLDPGTRRYGTLTNMLTANNRGVMREAEFAIREADVEAQMQTSFSRLGRAGPVQRLADALRTAGPRTNVQDLMAQAFGFQPADDVKKALEGPLGKLKTDMDALAAADPNKDKARVKELMAQAAVGGPVGAQAQAELDKLSQFYGVSPDQIARMESRDLRLSATARAARNVDASIPALKEALKKAGVATTKLGGKDANEALRLLEMGHKGSIDRARSLAESVLLDEGSMATMGEEGLATVRGLMDSTGRLKELAAKHTGGDVEKLLKGDFKADEATKQEVEKLKKQSTEATTKIGQALGAGKDQSKTWSDDYKARLGQYRDDLKKSGDQALTELFAMTGRKDVIDRQEISRIAKTAEGSDVLQKALTQARELKAQADKTEGGADAKSKEYVRLLRERGGIMGLMADAAEGKAMPSELLADEVSKAAKKEAGKPQAVTLAPGTKMDATGQIDLVSNQVNLTLTAPSN